MCLYEMIFGQLFAFFYSIELPLLRLLDRRESLHRYNGLHHLVRGLMVLEGGDQRDILRFLDCAKFLLEKGIKVRTMTLPDLFIDQANPSDMYKQALLQAENIVEKVLGSLGVSVGHFAADSSA